MEIGRCPPVILHTALKDSVQISSQTVFGCSHCSVQLVESQSGNANDLKNWRDTAARKKL